MQLSHSATFSNKIRTRRCQLSSLLPVFVRHAQQEVVPVVQLESILGNNTHLAWAHSTPHLKAVSFSIKQIASVLGSNVKDNHKEDLSIKVFDDSEVSIGHFGISEGFQTKKRNSHHLVLQLRQLLVSLNPHMEADKCKVIAFTFAKSTDAPTPDRIEVFTRRSRETRSHLPRLVWFVSREPTVASQRGTHTKGLLLW